MSELAQLPRRVTALEGRMDEVERLARGTDREVADWRTTLNNHTETLNAMSEKIDLFEKRVGERIDKFETRVGERIDKGFAEVEKKFHLLRRGQEQITSLLTRHLGESDEETRPGGADE